MDLLVTDDSPSQISDKIKDILYAKSADKIQDIKPTVAASIFDKDIDLDNPEPEAELDQDIELSSDEEIEAEVPGA